MKKLYKKYFWEILIAIAALSYSFEWFFIRNLRDLWYKSIDITFVKLFVSAMIIVIFYSFFDRKVYKKNKLKKKDYSLLLVLSILAIWWNTFFNEAITHTSIANVMVILYLSVFWTFLLSLFFFKEKFSIKKISYIFIAFVWIILVLIKDITNVSLELWIWDFYALVVSVLLAVSVVITKLMSHVTSFYRVMLIFTFSCLLIVLSIINTESIAYLWNFTNPDFLLYGWILAITSWVMWRWLKDLWIQYVPASIILVIMLLEPIWQISTWYFFANESINVVNMIWMMIVFYTIIWISKKEA